MTDPVREYLIERGCARHVIDGGLEYLIRSWEGTARELARGQEQQFDSFLNDLDGRDILDGVLEAVPASAQPDHVRRIREADELVRRHTSPAEECLWGKANQARHGWLRTRQWWYWALPGSFETGEEGLWPKPATSGWK